MPREFREGLPIKLLYVDDLILITETEGLLLARLREWKKGMELKGFSFKAKRVLALKLFSFSFSFRVNECW